MFSCSCIVFSFKLPSVPEYFSRAKGFSTLLLLDEIEKQIVDVVNVGIHVCVK